MVPLLLILAASPSQARLLRAQVTVANTHPVEDVIVLLKKLDSDAEEEGKTEGVTFQKFEHWCLRSKKTLQETIAQEKDTLESLADEIDAQKETMERLTGEIAALTKEIDRLGTAVTKADDMRGREEGVYTAKTASLTNTITALKSAIAKLELEHKNTDPSTAPALLQQLVGRVLAVAGSQMSASDRSMLETTPSTPNRPDLYAQGDYDQHIDDFKFKSGNIIELLKKLLQDFEQQETETIKAETNAVNAHQLAQVARDNATTAATASRSEKQGAHSDADTALQTAEGEQRDTQADLDVDTSQLGSTENSCELKATEWAERSKVRADEREAINVAIGILAKATGVRTTPPENPVLPESPVSFLQMPRSSEVKQAVELLREEARLSHSQAVSQLAAAVAANDEGPFDQVINSIEKMVFRLQDEQRQDDDHKNWCDKELATTDASIADQVDKIDELDSKISVAQARAGRLKREIGDANDMVSSIVSHMKEAVEVRKVGREENALAIKDAEAAQTALTQAIAVLTNFYKSSGAVAKEAWEFVQAPVTLSSPPPTWNSDYSAVDDPMTGSTSIIQKLEAVSASFSSMEHDTIAQEESDQSAYEEDMKSCKIEKARRAKEAETKALDRKNVIERQRSFEASRKRVLKEKEATDQYLRDLQPACVDGDSTYEDRKAARSKEITALKGAKGHLHTAFENVTSS